MKTETHHARFWRMKAEAAETEATRLRGALMQIHAQAGAVCPEYEVCEHPSCQASYTAWALADAALRGVA